MSVWVSQGHTCILFPWVKSRAARILEAFYAAQRYIRPLYWVADFDPRKRGWTWERVCPSMQAEYNWLTWNMSLFPRYTAEFLSLDLLEHNSNSLESRYGQNIVDLLRARYWASHLHYSPNGMRVSTAVPKRLGPIRKAPSGKKKRKQKHPL